MPITLLARSTACHSTSSSISACSRPATFFNAPKWALPRATNQPQDSKPETLRLSVDAQGTYYLNEQRVEDAALPALFREAAAKKPQPDLHIRGDKAVRYERVAEAMATAQQAGLKKIGFNTEPKH